MPHRIRTVAVVFALFSLTVGCSSGGSEPAAKEGASAEAAAQVVAPAKVEVIAGLTGCTAAIRIEAEELRQGSCRTAKGEYIIATFPKDSLKDTWLDAASVYGGTYIVGPQWAVGGKEDVLRKLQPSIGGQLVQLTGNGPSPLPSST